MVFKETQMPSHNKFEHGTFLCITFCIAQYAAKQNSIEEKHKLVFIAANKFLREKTYSDKNM
jgi:hypothetical protein